jgi:GT2 family glycosyltransferase
MPLTSIIIVSYRTGAVLFDAIQNVVASTADVELCLVDNGNPPDVIEKLHLLAASDTRIHFITGHGNVGFSRGCNLGARAAKGEYLLFLNPDSLLPHQAVEQLMQYAPKLKRPFMLGARLLNSDGSDQRGCRRALLTPTTALIEAFHLHPFFPKARLNFNNEPIPTSITPMPAISGAFMFLPREDFWKINGFDEGYFLHVEDLDLCLRFRRVGGEIYFVPDIVVTHLGGTSKVTTAFIERHKAHGFIRYFRQNFSATCPTPVLWMLNLAVWARTWLKIALSRTPKH